jgi:hypothetical protein
VIEIDGVHDDGFARRIENLNEPTCMSHRPNRDEMTVGFPLDERHHGPIRRMIATLKTNPFEPKAKQAGGVTKLSHRMAVLSRSRKPVLDLSKSNRSRLEPKKLIECDGAAIEGIQGDRTRSFTPDVAQEQDAEIES